MKEIWDFNRAVYVLAGEIELLKKITAAQNCVRQAVMNREWTDFDEKTLEVNRLGTEFAVLEEERVILFSCLEGESGSRGEEDKPFFVLISKRPEDERKELSCLYRDLKMETHKMKALNETFLAYLNEAKTLASAYIGAVCPDRGGKLYTRRGQTVSLDLRSIVINNRF